jgi:hypothetical protein
MVNRQRDHLAPASLLRLPTYTLTSGLALRIPLPREVRQVIIQNNTDKGGSPINAERESSLVLTHHSAPTMPASSGWRPPTSGSASGRPASHVRRP